MSGIRIRITRSSTLALWQTNFIKSKLEEIHRSIAVDVVHIKTKGDKILDSPPLHDRR
jgi:hydroxymethylbilane synthase